MYRICLLINGITEGDRKITTVSIKIRTVNKNSTVIPEIISNDELNKKTTDLLINKHSIDSNENKKFVSITDLSVYTINY